MKNRFIVASLAVALVGGAIAWSNATAQDREGPPGPPRHEDRGGDRGDRGRDDGSRGDRGPGGGPGDRGPGGQQGPGGPGGGPQAQLRMMRDLLGLISDYQKIAESPSSAGVAAVLSVNEHIRNPQSAAEFLEKLLPDVKDATVARAIRIQLADLYKKTDQQDKAKAQLEKLILGK